MMAGVQKQLESVLAATRENLAGARVIRAFRREDAEFEAFREKNRELTGASAPRATCPRCSIR